MVKVSEFGADDNFCAGVSPESARPVTYLSSVMLAWASPLVPAGCLKEVVNRQGARTLPQHLTRLMQLVRRVVRQAEQAGGTGRMASCVEAVLGPTGFPRSEWGLLLREAPSLDMLGCAIEAGIGVSDGTRASWRGRAAREITARLAAGVFHDKAVAPTQRAVRHYLSLGLRRFEILAEEGPALAVTAAALEGLCGEALRRELDRLNLGHQKHLAEQVAGMTQPEIAGMIGRAARNSHNSARQLLDSLGSAESEPGELFELCPPLTRVSLQTGFSDLSPQAYPFAGHRPSNAAQAALVNGFSGCQGERAGRQWASRLVAACVVTEGWFGRLAELGISGLADLPGLFSGLHRATEQEPECQAAGFSLTAADAAILAALVRYVHGSTSSRDISLGGGSAVSTAVVSALASVLASLDPHEAERLTRSLDARRARGAALVAQLVGVLQKIWQETAQGRSRAASKRAVEAYCLVHGDAVPGLLADPTSGLLRHFRSFVSCLNVSFTESRCCPERPSAS